MSSQSEKAAAPNGRQGLFGTEPRSTAKDNALRVGDFITLKFPKKQSYLSSEGILVEGACVSSSMSRIEEHVFQIYVQRQYSATNELRDFLADYPDIDAGKMPTDVATISHYEALLRGKENEFNLNRSVMQSKTGNILYFGDTIQLRHVKSKKYITACEDLARDERENMRVIVHPDGSVNSWLKVMPRFKINREGEPVINGTEVLLKFSERNNEFLHCADRIPPRGKLREVNSSLESPTGWKLGIYQKAFDIANVNLLLSGQLVYLRDPESLSMLSPLPLQISLETPKVHLQTENLGILSPTEATTFDLPWNSSSKFLGSAKSISRSLDDGKSDGDDNENNDDDDDMSISSFEEFVKEFGGVVLKPGIEEKLDFDALWLLESKSIVKAGPIAHQTDKVMFRHFNTGRYLGMEQREDGSDGFTFSLENEPNEKSTMFYVTEINSGGSDLLRNAKAVQIKHAYYGVSIQRGEYRDGQKAYACLSTRSKSKALNMIINRYVQKDESTLRAANISILQAAEEEALDVHFGKAVMYHLAKFVRLISFPSFLTNDTSTIWPRMDSQDIKFFPVLMARTALFVRGYPIRLKLGSDEMIKFKATKQTIVRRQNMLRELGLVEAMMVMIQKLQPISDMLNSEASTRKVFKGSFAEAGRDVLSDCLGLLYDLIKNNVESQLYIADHLLVILAHVSTDRVAAKVAQELLSDNRELQETKIGVKEITIFTQKMRDVHMNSMYLQLLKTCCSCLGQGLSKNQDIVHHVLFHIYKDVLIDVRLDSLLTTNIDWDVSTSYGLYLEPAKKSSGLLAANLLTHGAASVKITWRIVSQRFAIHKLFNKPEVFLSELEIRERMATSSKKDGGNDDAKTAIHDFFVAQLQLAAEMCLGRNYPIIESMERRYSYELLVTMLKVGISEAVRGGAAYLLQYLYVDRDPQTETPVPRLTRTLSEVSRPNFSELVCIAGEAGHKFALLQAFISQHLESINHNSFAVHTLNVLGLLHCLIRFHFYGKEEFLIDTVKHLVGCLKRDEIDDLANDFDVSGLVSNVQKMSLSSRSSSSKKMRVVSSRLGVIGKSPSGISDASSANNSDAHMNTQATNKSHLTIVQRLSACVNRITAFFTVNAKSNTEKNEAGNVIWTPPNRHIKTNEYTLRTLEKAVNILFTIQQNMIDRKLSLFLSLFHAMNSGSSQKAPHALFEEVITQSSKLYISNDNYDDIYMDLIMYSQPSLVQSVLDLLMYHHNSNKFLLEHISKLQLITSIDGEKNFTRLEIVLTTLKRHADTHDIWGKLETAEHRKISTETHNLLLELTSKCKKPREILQFDESYEPIKFIQNVLRNLGCFEMCMKLIKLIILLDKDDATTMTESYLNTVNLSLAANRLLYWFILDNPYNQQLAYSEFSFFMKIIDSKVESHLTISAMFKDNLELMEKVPKKYISEFVEMICNIGKFPQYLSLMSSIISVGEKNVIANQYEVIRLMSSPENQKKIVLFFVPQTHPEYAKKIRLMSHYLDVHDITVKDLPSDLAYHLELMGLLSSCTIGTSGMTSIEAKVQSIYSFVDVIDAMLDPNCLLLAKIRYGLFLYNAMLDVETPLPALKDANSIWKVLAAAQDVFLFAKDELRQIEKNGLHAPSSHRQKIEFMLVNAMIVEGYFRAYFDYTIFKPEVGQIAVGVERIQLKEIQAYELIRQLFHKIMALYEMLSPLLNHDQQTILFNALTALNNASKEKIVAEVVNIHDAFFNSAQEYIAQDEDKTGKAYEQFVTSLTTDADIKGMVQDQIQDFIRKIESLPSTKDSSSSSLTSSKAGDVRFEPFLEKLVTHIRNSIQLIIHGDETIKFVPPNATQTSIWILKVLLTMIENRWGMTIYERDDDGGEEQDDAVADLMLVYNSCGVTEMCLDLISKGIDVSLQSEALKLLVGMLFKEGGALAIQRTIHAHLSHPGSDIFFRTVRQILHNLMAWHEWNKIIILPDEEGIEPSLPDEIIIIRCLQLFCEGHFKPNQEILREQPQNNVSINLLDDFVLYLQKLDRYRCRTSTTAGLSVLSTILEVIQGPCEENQTHFALNTELVETLNRKLRQHPENDCIETDEMTFKTSSLDIFQALLEGQGRKIQIYERILSVIHVDVLLVLCKGNTPLTANNKEENEEESEESLALRTESLVLLQMLADFRPSLKAELNLGDNFAKEVGNTTSVACIEVVWRGELQRRFFSVPTICNALAKSTKDNFILNVKRSSPEDKLFGLLEASKEMYRECLHQQLLKEFHLDFVFSRTNQASASWFNFYIATIINILFLIYYSTQSVDASQCTTAVIQTGPYRDTTALNADETTCLAIHLLDPNITTVTFALTLILIAGSSYTLISNLVVRGPVLLLSFREKGYSFLRGVLYTACDMSFLRYIICLALSVIGIFYHPALAVVLLDFISMSPTTQAVLNAVWDPRLQITMTVVLIFIMIYIYAMFEFFFLSDPPQSNFTDDSNSETLANMFKFLLRYGFPYNSPENQMQFTLSGYRVICDVLFFLSCTIMVNVLKGITIDTFVALRAKLEKRVADTTERCFMCGIEKNTFNRTLDRDAFRQHITNDQNLWNYIYFIMFIWEQDKDDDDGFEYYARHCIEDNDLTWFPMNKAIRLAEYQDKGDVRSLKYRFRKTMERDETVIDSRMKEFKEQVSRTINRVEKALEYEQELDTKRAKKSGGRASFFSSPTRMSVSAPITPGPMTQTPGGGGIPRSIRSAGLTDDVVSAINSARSRTSNQGSSVSSAFAGLDNIPANNKRLAPAPAPAFIAANTGGIAFPNITTTNALSGSSAASVSSTLDMENFGQLHMRILFITGLLLVPEHIKYIQVKVSTDFESAVIRPIADMQVVTSLDAPMEEDAGNKTHYSSSQLAHVTSSLKYTKRSLSMNSSAFNRTGSKSNGVGDVVEETVDERVSRMKLQFDVMENPAILVHQGALPKYDLSKVMVKIQVIFDASADHNGSKDVYLGGIRIPLILLLNRAMEGGVLELPMLQRFAQLKVITKLEEESSPKKMLKALTDVIESVESGEEVPIEAPAISFSKSGKHMTTDVVQRVSLTENIDCMVAVSAIASHQLLQDWAMLR